MVTRKLSELGPTALGLISAMSVFGMKDSLTAPNPFLLLVVGIAVAAGGVYLGWWFVGRNGRNAVVFLGVVFCLLVIFVEAVALVAGALWYS